MRPHLLLSVLALLPATAAAADPAGADFFETKVRPALVEYCFGCHSAKAAKLKGGLRLDTRAGLLKGGDAGPVVVPGDTGKSRLVAAINYKDVDLQMPPKGKLPDAVILNLTAWVKMGAPWPDTAATHATGSPKAFDLQRRKTEHWAWRPVRPTTPPTVQDGAWPLTPVDRYLRARLEAAGLRPAPPADSETVLRRATFDLTGLPPTPDEIDAFLADPAPDAFARAVDRLLASPAFGERWGRHWLDLVRYAETRGHEFDYPVPNAHQYRDYVIRALNADVPYDRFVAEHVAGDLLPDPRRHTADGFDESILGTGFWLFGDMVHSPVDLRQDQADRLDNMIDVFSKTFLGLTVACARCHDHKYDAISTKDYYALMGVIEGASSRQVRFDARDASVAAPIAALRRDRGPAVRAALAVGLRPLTDRLADALPPAELRAATRDERHPFHAWAVLANVKDFTAARTTLREAARRRAGDAAHALDGATVVVDYAHAGSDDWLPDGVSFGSGPVRAGDLLFAPDADRPVGGIATITAARFDAAWAHVAEASGCDLDPGDLHYPRAGRTLRTRSFVIERPKLYSLVRGTGRVFACVNGHTLMEGPLHRKLVKKVGGADGFSWVEHDLSRYRGERVHVEFTAGDGDFAVALVVQGDHAPGRVDGPGPKLLALLDAETPAELEAAYRRLAAEAVQALADGTLGQDADLSRVADVLLRCAPPACEGPLRQFGREQQTILADAKLAAHLAPALWDANGVTERVFVRGSPKTLGDAVPRRFLEALAGSEPLAAPHGSGRLELARLVTDPDRDPFLARVAVNRVWHHLFGRGIVASVDNFGVLGEQPSHPELLDWLADDFVRGGWSVKSLVRTLMLSRAYQMSSRPDPKAAATDPQNVLLHRANVRRLEGEALRDALLAASGRLDRTLYGPPVPTHLTPFMDGRGRPKESGPLDGAGRRSIYLAVRRNFPEPLLVAFDTPPPATTVGRRTVSNVPAQALILMNDPFVHQQAELWGRRSLAAGRSPAERVAGMVRQAYGRRATDGEVRDCLDFLTGQAGQYHAPPDDPRAWADLAHALVNAKEFIFLR